MTDEARSDVETPLEDARPRPHISLGIDFRAGGDGQDCILDGWWQSEPKFTWTRGRSSFVRLPALGVDRDAVLSMSIAPHVAGNKLPYQRVEIIVNGVPCTPIIVRRPVEIEFVVPKTALTADCPIDIEIRCPYARSPAQVRDSLDRRVLGVALRSIQLSALEPVEEAYEPGDKLRGPDLAMLSDVASLGINCELGFVQRWGGVEPIDLFRWTFTPLQKLLVALEARFVGFGTPENLEVTCDGAEEFQIRDKRFGFRIHSFEFRNRGANSDGVLRRAIRRMPFLLRKFLAELEDASRLYVYHDAGESTEEQVERLVLVLRTYGKNTLLWVVKATDAIQVGKSEFVHDGLLRGYIDDFQPVGDVGGKETNDAWISVLREAHRIWRLKAAELEVGDDGARHVV